MVPDKYKIIRHSITLKTVVILLVVVVVLAGLVVHKPYYYSYCHMSPLCCIQAVVPFIFLLFFFLNQSL